MENFKIERETNTEGKKQSALCSSDDESGTTRGQ
jgi:hypothetical protein